MNTYRIQVDPALAQEAQTVFLGLGTDISSAVNLFLRQTVLKKDLPFSIEDPDQCAEVELLAKHRRGVEAIRAGKGIHVTMEQLEAMAGDE